MPRNYCRTLLLLTAALLAIAVHPARAQQQPWTPPIATATLTSSTPTITLDARNLDHVTELDLPWRYHAATNASDHTFASSTFDDSAWPAILLGPAFGSAHQPNLETHIVWARIHLHIADPSSEKLGILIDLSQGLAYAVFANGQPIAATPEFASGYGSGRELFVIALPQTSEITLAIEFYRIRENFFRSMPMQSFSIGELNLATTAAELNRRQLFEAIYPLSILIAALYLCFATVAFILFLNQRDRLEYLWLGMFLLGMSCYTAFRMLRTSGAIPDSLLNFMIWRLLATVGVFLPGLEFILLFSGVSNRRLARIFQAYLVLFPLTFFINEKVYVYSGLLWLILWLVFVSIALVRGYRSGRVECGLLLLPLSAFALSWILQAVPGFSAVTLKDLTLFRDVSLLAFLVCLMALILVRFIRVSREEQHSASELEAARTVQQVLVPEDTPSIPGYEVATLYRPAQQVGGDFFQIVPLPSRSNQPTGETPTTGQTQREADLLIVAGDVTGKGLQAGMLVALIVGAIRATADLTPDPLAILQSLNRRLLSRGASQATCLAMLVTPSGAVTLANAGHIPPYLNGEPIDMQGALPLGMIDEAEFSVMHFQLNPSDKLVVVSDGILEATSPTGELFGFDRTAAMLKSHQTIEQVADAAQSFSQTSAQQDDISLVQLTRTA